MPENEDVLKKHYDDIKNSKLYKMDLNVDNSVETIHSNLKFFMLRIHPDRLVNLKEKTYSDEMKDQIFKIYVEIYEKLNSIKNKYSLPESDVDNLDSAIKCIKDECIPKILGDKYVQKFSEQIENLNRNTTQQQYSNMNQQQYNTYQQQYYNWYQQQYNAYQQQYNNWYQQQYNAYQQQYANTNGQQQYSNRTQEQDDPKRKLAIAKYGIFIKIQQAFIDKKIYVNDGEGFEKYIKDEINKNVENLNLSEVESISKLTGNELIFKFQLSKNEFENRNINRNRTQQQYTNANQQQPNRTNQQYTNTNKQPQTNRTKEQDNPKTKLAMAKYGIFIKIQQAFIDKKIYVNDGEGFAKYIKGKINENVENLNLSEVESISKLTGDELIFKFQLSKNEFENRNINRNRTQQQYGKMNQQQMNVEKAEKVLQFVKYVDGIKKFKNEYQADFNVYNKLMMDIGKMSKQDISMLPDNTIKKLNDICKVKKWYEIFEPILKNINPTQVIYVDSNIIAKNFYGILKGSKAQLQAIRDFNKMDKLSRFQRFILKNGTNKTNKSINMSLYLSEFYKNKIFKPKNNNIKQIERMVKNGEDLYKIYNRIQTLSGFEIKNISDDTIIKLDNMCRDQKDFSCFNKLIKNMEPTQFANVSSITIKENFSAILEAGYRQRQAIRDYKLMDKLSKKERFLLKTITNKPKNSKNKPFYLAKAKVNITVHELHDVLKKNIQTKNRENGINMHRNEY